MDPKTGRFTTSDKYLGRIEDPTSLHKYLYAHSNKDPSGYMSLLEIAGASGINISVPTYSIAIIFGIVGGALIGVGTIMGVSDYLINNDFDLESVKEALSGALRDSAFNETASFAKEKKDSKTKGNKDTAEVKDSDVEIPKSVERKAKKLSPEAKKGFDKGIEALKKGDTRGLNEHQLTGNRKGQSAIDMKGTGGGRGAGRIIFERVKGVIKIIDIITDHRY